MCEEWWDERLLREQAEKLKRSIAPTRSEPDGPERERRGTWLVYAQPRTMQRSGR